MFFFSSRRRHTRLQGDWSSDVCSSDLAAVREAWNGLPADQRERVELDLPNVETPVAARALPLVRALSVVLGELLGQGSRVRLRVWPELTEVRMSVEDDGGGLPQAILDRWVDPDSGSPIGAAVGEIRAMGGGLRHETFAGAGLRLEFSFPVF